MRRLNPHAAHSRCLESMLQPQCLNAACSALSAHCPSRTGGWPSAAEGPGPRGGPGSRRARQPQPRPPRCARMLACAPCGRACVCVLRVPVGALPLAPLAPPPHAASEELRGSTPNPPQKPFITRTPLQPCCAAASDEELVKAAAAADSSMASRYISAAMSVVEGSHGPKVCWGMQGGVGQDDGAAVLDRAKDGRGVLKGSRAGWGAGGAGGEGEGGLHEAKKQEGLGQGGHVEKEGAVGRRGWEGPHGHKWVSGHAGGRLGEGWWGQ